MRRTKVLQYFITSQVTSKIFYVVKSPTVELLVLYKLKVCKYYIPENYSMSTGTPTVL